MDPDIISGNLTNMFSNTSGNKSNIYERDWSKFGPENFTLNHFFVDWEDLLKSDELNADNSTRMYLDKINMLLDRSKPWITLGLQKSISVKNKLHKNFINKKVLILKEEFYTNYKKY